MCRSLCRRNVYTCIRTLYIRLRSIRGFSLDSHLATAIIFFLVFFAVKFPNRFACVICRVKVAVFFITEFALCFFSTSCSAAHMVFQHGYFFFTCDDKTVFEFCRSVNRLIPLSRSDALTFAELKIVFAVNAIPYRRLQI